MLYIFNNIFYSYVFFISSKFKRYKWMSDLNKSGITRAYKESNDDIAMMQTYIHFRHFMHKRKRRLVGDELPTKWNNKPYKNTYILYLIDLVVYYLCSVRLHNTKWAKTKHTHQKHHDDNQNKKDEQIPKEWNVNKIVWRKRNDAKNEKKYASDFMVHCSSSFVKVGFFWCIVDLIKKFNSLL